MGTGCLSPFRTWGQVVRSLLAQRDRLLSRLIEEARKDLAHEHCGEDAREAHDDARREHLVVEDHAEDDREDALEREEQRGGRGLDGYPLYEESRKGGDKG